MPLNKDSKPNQFFQRAFCIIRAAAENSFARVLKVLKLHGGAYILSSTEEHIIIKHNNSTDQLTPSDVRNILKDDTNIIYKN